MKHDLIKMGDILSLLEDAAILLSKAEDIAEEEGNDFIEGSICTIHLALNLVIGSGKEAFKEGEGDEHS